MKAGFKVRKAMMVVLCISLAGCVTVSSRKQPRVVEGKVGRLLPLYSFSVDADYDPRLDGLIPGYKLLPVIMRNLSLRGIQMDVEKDRWTIVGEKGQRYRAVNSLRIKDPVQWREMPEKLRRLIDYPEVIPINYNVTFDLLIPSRAHLDYFREIEYFNASLRQHFIIREEY